MAKKIYFCTRNVEHDRQPYGHGDAIELEDAHAKALLDCGAIVEKKPQGAEQSGGESHDTGGGQRPSQKPAKTKRGGK